MNFKKSPLLSFIFLLVLIFGSAKNGFSQIDIANGKIVAFHPSVGNSITVKEKKEFSIFSEYSDSLFESIQLVKYSNQKYALLVKTTNAKSFEKSVTLEELDNIYASIEKVKPASKINPPQDDYVQQEEQNEKKSIAIIAAEEEERVKRERRKDIAAEVGEMTLQILFIFLEIVAQSY